MRVCVFVLMWIGGNVFAQTFSGRVVDEGKEGVAFANAVLVSLPDSGFVCGTAANEVGEFVLEAGGKANKYLLKITALGYEPFNQAFDKGQRLGDIVLKAGVVQVQEVSVVAVRPKIRMERGIYIADIENTIAAIGNTVETLLKQLPGVRVYRDGISV
ncbi:MAG: carboxypeptidase-like regulatory domain-containing protein, partial [Tannerellaceae bacterium]|nr:carboxypeptidase-like regulatory domain-containing protein [Tannerellaceae bacterium]